MTDKERCPAEPVAGDDGDHAQGGFAKAAEVLNELDPSRPRPISRQLVHKWWINRHFNGFPASVDTKGNGNGGRGRPVFDLTDVTSWYTGYVNYRRHRGSQPQATQKASAKPPASDGGDTLAA